MAGQMDDINTKPESDNKTTSERKRQRSDLNVMTSEAAMLARPSNMSGVSSSFGDTHFASQQSLTTAGQTDNINIKPESDNKTTSEPKPHLRDLKEMTFQVAMPVTLPCNMLEVGSSLGATRSVSQQSLTMAGQMDNINIKTASDNKTTSEPKLQLSDMKEMISQVAKPARLPSNAFHVSSILGDTHSVSQVPSVQTPTTSTGSAFLPVRTAIPATASESFRNPQLMLTADSDMTSVLGESSLWRRNVHELSAQGIREPTFGPPRYMPPNYLEPEPYVKPASVPEVLPAPMPLYPMPMLVIPDPNILQRAHSELQQLIERQQQQRQRILARFGIYPPIAGVQDLYPYPGGLVPDPILPPRVPYAGMSGMSTLQVPSRSHRSQQRSPSRRSPNPVRQQNTKKNSKNMPPQQ